MSCVTYELVGTTGREGYECQTINKYTSEWKYIISFEATTLEWTLSGVREQYASCSHTKSTYKLTLVVVSFPSKSDDE
jgi:hypothetical protein